MCLVTKMIEPDIAEKDIICYKIIRMDMTSLHYNEFKWELGKIYTSWIETFEKPIDYEVYQAFHSYESLEDLREAYYMVTEPCLTVKCTIPSGSRVYRGKHANLKGYASNQLIINEVMGVKELYPDFDWDKYPYKEGQVIKHKSLQDNTWKDYQITNIQPSPIKKNRIDLIGENLETLDSACIVTKFDGVAWVSDWETLE